MPSGSKKRKTAKRKMESSSVTIATIQQGNGGSESGSEVNSPMSPDVAQFDGEQRKDDGGGELETGGTGGDVVSDENGGGELETGGTGGDVVSDENGGEKMVVKEKESISPEKSAVEEDKVDEVEPALSHDEASASDTSELVSISQPEVVNVEHVETEKKVVLLAPEDKEKLENPVPIVVEQPVPISSEEKEEAAQTDIHVEKVEPSEQSPIDKIEEVVKNSGSGNPSCDEVEEKDNVVDSQQLSSHEKEDKVETLNSVKPSCGEKREDNEASCPEEPPSNEEEEKVVRLSDSKSAEQFAASHDEPVQSECRAIVAEVHPPSQAVPRTSWLNCCGLFDAFVGSN